MWLKVILVIIILCNLCLHWSESENKCVFFCMLLDHGVYVMYAHIQRNAYQVRDSSSKQNQLAILNWILRNIRILYSLSYWMSTKVCMLPFSQIEYKMRSIAFTCCLPFCNMCHSEICFRLAWCRSEKCIVLKHASNWHNANFVISRADNNSLCLSNSLHLQ